MAEMGRKADFAERVGEASLWVTLGVRIVEVMASCGNVIVAIGAFEAALPDAEAGICFCAMAPAYSGGRLSQSWLMRRSGQEPPRAQATAWAAMEGPPSP